LVKKEEMIFMDNQTTVGKKEGLGAGIVGIGLMMLFLPSASQKIADLDFTSGTPFGILLGATLILGILIVLAGVAVVIMKFDEDE
jgi:hypothetical protein